MSCSDKTSSCFKAVDKIHTRARPEELAAKLRHVDVLLPQGRSVAEAVRSIGVTQFGYYRWRKEFGGLKEDRLKRPRELEKENDRLRKAVSDLTLEKPILKEAAPGSWSILQPNGNIWRRINALETSR